MNLSYVYFILFTYPSKAAGKHMRERGPLYLFTCLALAAAFFCAFAPPAAARYYYSWERKPKKPFFIKARVRRWQTATSAQTRSTWLTPYYWWTPPAEGITIGTTNDFKVMDAPLYLFSAEVQPVKGLSFEFETGDNRFSEGKYAGHDWVHAPNSILTFYDSVVWEAPQHRDYAQRETETRGSARQYSTAVHLTVYKTDGLAMDGEYEMQHTLDFFVGYSWYGTRVKLFNGNKTLSTDFFLPTAPAGPMTGLNSWSNMVWQGWRGGFREQANLGKNFYAEAKFAFGPTMKYRGQTYWNLDTTLAKPGIRNRATGHLVEFEISASYKFWKQFEFEGGWMAWAYTAASGRDMYYYADGTTWEGDLDRVKATRKGVFFGLSWKY